MRLFGRLAVLGGMTLAMTACGKKGVLVYPDMLVPVAPSAASAFQSGSGVKIQFEVPTTDRTGNRLNDLAGLNISKRESDSAPDQTCPACLDDYHLFRKLYLDLLPDSAQRFGNRLVLLDGEVRTGKSYSYIVTSFTKEGVAGASSPRLAVHMIQAVLPPILQAESFPTEIKISFVSLPPDMGTLVGHNLYRMAQKDALTHFPINREPLAGKDYIDSGLARGIRYRYLARAVVRLETGAVVESLVSNEVEGMLKDDE